MLILKVIFIVLCCFSIACALKGLTYKRKNIGFVILTVTIAIADVISILLFNVQNAKAAAQVLLPFYFIHAWAFCLFMLVVMQVDDRWRYWPFAAAGGVIGAYQTYLVISQYRGARIFSFAKRIYFKKPFWVAVDSKNTGLFFSFRSYRLGIYICMFLTFCLIIACISRSHRIFRSRYYGFFAVGLGAIVLEWIVIRYSLPIWIPSLAYNVLPPLLLYLTGAYAWDTLREWSLDSFANDMSDGLVLYDRYDDLIHINDMIKSTLESRLLEDFRDKKKLEQWISDQNHETGMEVITYNNGSRDYYFKVTEKSLGDEKSQIGTLFIIHDTTDSFTRILAVQKANEELERANRMKSDFLANMSHEIRTPMNAVIGMAELAIRENDPAQRTDYLVQIQNSGENLLNIINDILDYSKIEAGKMEIMESEYKPLEELTDTANVLVTRIGEKPLELFVFAEPGIPRALLGDAMRIRQVLINLANNAIKFTKQGMVKVTVKAEKTAPDMVNVTFHVVDTGIGIKEEDLKKLFVSFQQVDSKRNRSVEGTGLGLAISKKLVEAMNGQIGVNSEYGKGSDFWFSIPQKVLDGADDLVVENAGSKRAFVFNKREGMASMFLEETRRLGVDGIALSSLDSYVPSDKKDFLFFDEEIYDDEMKAFLDDHKDISASVLTPYDSAFKPDRDNVYVMRRPAFTVNLVNTLNEKYMVVREQDEEKVFRIDYTAPDAKILLVDDNHINLTIAGGLIAPLKAQIDTADGGQAAIDKAMANEYDIIFMDHMMPEVDGVDATRAIRNAGDSIRQPVIIALSANVMEEAKQLFMEAGMNDFVPKPVEIKKIITTIKRWLPEDKIVEGGVDEGEAAGTAQAESSVRVSFEGIDTDSAVRALGSAELYDEIAAEYYRSGEEKLGSIIEAYENEDWTNYTIRVHALKSSSRQIGAMELGDMAEALEKAGNALDLDKIRSDTEGTLDEFRRILGGLSQYYESGEEEADGPLIDNETLNDILSRLEVACDDLDMDGMDQIDEELKGYTYEDDIKEDIASLRKAIANIDAEGCMEIISKIKR